MPKIDCYGWQGVNTTKNPIQLDDNELSKAQNAFRDPAGEHGALRKRPGLTKVNSVALSGSVLGFINVPLNEIQTRRFFVGVDQAVTTAYQWITSTDAFGTTSTATTPAACAKPGDSYLVPSGLPVLTNRGCQSESLFIYPGNYTRGTAQPVRAYDGAVDKLLFEVPLNPKAISDYGLTDYAIRVGSIPFMRLEGSKLYLCSIDYSVAGTGAHSRLLEYDFDSGVLSQIGESASGWNGDIGAASTGGATGGGTQVFFCCALHQGYLYAGVGSHDTTNSEASGVYRIRPGVDTAWTYDFDNGGAGNADLEVPMCMESYKGKLYVGMRDLNSFPARLMVRDFAGTYTSSLTVGSANGSGFFAMRVFGDNLYVTAHDNNGASSITTIRKFDGTSWTTVKTIDTGTATPRVGVELVVHNGRLYCLAVSSAKNAVVTHTSDGTTWTDLTSNLTGGNIVSIFGALAY